MIEFKKYTINIPIFVIIINKFRYKKEFYLIILIKLINT